MNLPDQWVEDLEVIKLFLLFRSKAINAMPLHQQIGGKLLDEAHIGVVELLKSILKGKYVTLGSDGWKDESRNSVKGGNVTCKHKGVLTRRDNIIAGQVGAETFAKHHTKLTNDATAHIDLIDNILFQKQLKAIVDDIEPICLGDNVNKTDSMRVDQGLLTLVGIFFHFKKHSVASVTTGMMKRIEGHWNALDQPLFIFTLVINPFEKLTHFGDKANVLPFTLNDLVLQLFCRVNSWPLKQACAEDEERRHKEDF
ncbi:hypothetical protein PQX77_002350 [Marasmius sp. AFHP31]|nr:hypothetical protein PQX77_002350 [Marasmius sp. AFHP31]